MTYSLVSSSVYIIPYYVLHMTGKEERLFWNKRALSSFRDKRCHSLQVTKIHDASEE